MKLIKIFIVIAIFVPLLLVILFLYVRNEPCRFLQSIKDSAELKNALLVDYDIFSNMVEVGFFQRFDDFTARTGVRLSVQRPFPDDYEFSFQNNKLYIGPNYRFLLEVIADKHELKRSIICD